MNYRISLLVTVLMGFGSAATAQLPVAVSFEIDIPAMTERYSWRQNGRKAEVESSVRGDVVNALGREFDYWRFVEAETGPTAGSCRVSLIEEGQREALLELECQPQSSCNLGELRLTARLWAPSEFGAGCAKSTEEIQSKLPAEILARLITEESRRPRIKEWLEKCVPISTEGRWHGDHDSIPQILLPIDLALQCSWFKLYCSSTQGAAEIYAKGVGRHLPYLRLNNVGSESLAVVAEPKELHHAGKNNVVKGARVQIESAEFELQKDLQMTGVYLKDYDGECSPLMSLEGEL